MGVEHTSGTDTRTETTDKPTPSERPYAPPPDNPGSPGQPSRLQDRARVREQTQECSTQDNRTVGTEQPAERDDKPALSRDESDGEGAGKPERPDQEKDEDSGTSTGEHDQREPGIAETERPQDQGREPGTPEQGARDTDKPSDQDGEPQAERSREAPDQLSAEQQKEGQDSAQPTKDAELTPQVPDQTAEPQEPGADSNTLDNGTQRALGEELAELADKEIDSEIDNILDKVNPNFDQTKSAYSENCTGVVQANELQRRGSEVEAGPLERYLRTDEGGPGGRPLRVIEEAWGARFTPGTKIETEEAFKQPGSRGIVYIAWTGPGGGAHVFNVENVGGKVRFIDGQPTPPVQDASHYFDRGRNTKYLRVDDLATPPDSTMKRFLEP